MDEMLKAIVIINVIPARSIITLKNFIIACFPMFSKVGIMESKKLMVKNIARIINKIREKIIMPYRRNTKTAIPILNRNNKYTIPKRAVVFVMVKFLLS